MQAFINAQEGSTNYYLRAGFIHELCAISENLNFKRTSPLLQKYPSLFTVAKRLRGLRDILTHRYGLPDPTIDWSLVWRVFDSELGQDLLPPLNEAIEGEKTEDEEVE